MDKPRSLTILTGASRGLGAAMAEQLMTSGAMLLTMSRHLNQALNDNAAAAGAVLEQWSIDLADGTCAAASLEAWISDQKYSFSSATLINNAALAGKPGPIDESDTGELAAVLRVGLEAPMLLTRAFLRATSEWNVPRRVLNISSGAGKKPLAGTAAYCAVKAGLDHFSRVVALDEARRAKGAKIVSLAPGVIDTNMQTELRQSDPRMFPDQPLFAAMKTGGQLASPAAAAAKVLAYLARPDFGSNPVADVRDS
ncbi:MAG TPA: SDR family NAD(P)-dependent oxidoreductase [Burkholderiaceae bacterium]|nr:SDR family NAD(P)-dependent oxidoreductase [Burkholderiaceae bacterium]